MSQTLYFKMELSTQHAFQSIHQDLNAGSSQRQAKRLGNVLADLACEVIDQVFAELLRKPSVNRTESKDASQAQSSEKVVAHILHNLRKYMPYAVTMFGNERLLPMVNYLDECMLSKDGQFYLTYCIPDELVEQNLNWIEKIRGGDDQAVQPAFKSLIQLIDMGVDALIIHPKKMLKFNLLVNKTLDGVIHLSTHMGYQRLEKVASHLTAVQAVPYLEHFIEFLHLPDSIATTL